MIKKILFRTLIRIYILSLLLLLPEVSAAQNNLVSGLYCDSESQDFAFTIKKAWTSNTGKDISTMMSVFAGDIDGDGITEILSMNIKTNRIYIFDGRDGTIVGTIELEKNVAIYGYWLPILICDVNKNGKAEIFVVGYHTNPIVRLYEVSSAAGVRPMTFNTIWSHSYKIVNDPTSEAYSNTMPVVADLDGDGIPEFIAGNHIINSKTGLSMAQMALSGMGTYVSFPLTVDLDHDGLPEVVVGTNVYKYNAGTLILWRTCPNVVQQEGVNMYGDINADGEIDLAFLSKEGFLKVWTPNTNQDLGTIVSNMGPQASYPFVGDIDGIVINGKKYLEVIVNTSGMLYAYSYNGTNFALKWQMSHTDMSGATAVTLFDFNNDGISEIVYRDQTHLHIFNGAGVSPIDATPPVTCGAGTGVEGPIIVDANGDGSANIVVTGDPAGGNNVIPGEVMVFEGAASKWMSCPSVWNQQLYSNLLVNKDLTIPATIKSPDLSFTQTCTKNMGDKVHFYNGGPMQAPYISDITYCPIDLSSDVYIVDGNLTVLSPTSVSISITVGNLGAAVAPSATPIRYYENSITSGNVVFATTLGVDLFPGQTTVITKTITVPSSMSAFYVRVLDDGKNFPAAGAFSDCNLNNNKKLFNAYELTDDYLKINICNPTVIIIDVLANDTMLPCNRNILTININNNSKIGALFSIDNVSKNIIYNTNNNFGRDTLQYTVLCNDSVYIGYVFINVNFIYYNDTIYETICSGDNYNAYNFNLIDVQTSTIITHNLLTVSNCDSIITLNLTVNPRPTAGIINNSNATELTCKQTNILLTAIGGGNYNWSNNLGSSANVTILQSGTYTVTVSNSDNACTSSANITITQDSAVTITQAPPLTIEHIDYGTILCFDGTTKFSVTVSGGTLPYIYDINNGITSYNTNKNLKISAGQYKIHVTDTNNCHIDTVIIINQPDELIFSPNFTHPTCNKGKNGIINLNLSGGIMPYRIYLNDKSYGSNPQIKNLGQGTYNIAIKDANACIASGPDIQLVDAQSDCLNIPNVITPNDDGINDYWIIDGINNFENYQIFIYNRWGQNIFYSSDYQPWDGTYKSKKLPTGTYLYVIRITDELKYSGQLSIIY